jgi:hypothetical protein
MFNWKLNFDTIGHIYPFLDVFDYYCACVTVIFSDGNESKGRYVGIINVNIFFLSPGIVLLC